MKHLRYNSTIAHVLFNGRSWGHFHIGNNQCCRQLNFFLKNKFKNKIVNVANKWMVNSNYNYDIKSWHYDFKFIVHATIINRNAGPLKESRRPAIFCWFSGKVFARIKFGRFDLIIEEKEDIYLLSKVCIAKYIMFGNAFTSMAQFLQCCNLWGSVEVISGSAFRTNPLYQYHLKSSLISVSSTAFWFIWRHREKKEI